MATFNREKARAAGYTEDEINDYLASHQGPGQMSSSDDGQDTMSGERGFLGNLIKGISESAFRLPGRLYAETANALKGGKGETVHVPGLMGGMDVTPLSGEDDLNTFQKVRKVAGETLETGLTFVPGIGAAKVAGEAGLAVRALSKTRGAFGKTVQAARTLSKPGMAGFGKELVGLAKTGAKYGAGFGLAKGWQDAPDDSLLPIKEVINGALTGALFAPALGATFKGVGALKRLGSEELSNKTITGRMENLTTKRNPTPDLVANYSNRPYVNHIDPFAKLTPEETVNLTPAMEKSKISEELGRMGKIVKSIEDVKTNVEAKNPWQLIHEEGQTVVDALSKKISKTGKELENLVDKTPVGRRVFTVDDIYPQMKEMIESITGHPLIKNTFMIDTSRELPGGRKVDPRYVKELSEVLSDLTSTAKKGEMSIQGYEHMIDRWNSRGVYDKLTKYGGQDSPSSALLTQMEAMLRMKAVNAAENTEYAQLNSLYGRLKDLRSDVSPNIENAQWYGKILNPTSAGATERAQLFEELRQHTGIDLIRSMKFTDAAIKKFGDLEQKTFLHHIVSSVRTHTMIGVWSRMRVAISTVQKYFSQLAKGDDYDNILKIINASTKKAADETSAATSEAVMARIASDSEKIAKAINKPVEEVRPAVEKLIDDLQNGATTVRGSEIESLIKDSMAGKVAESAVAKEAAVNTGANLAGLTKTIQAWARGGPEILTQGLVDFGVPEQLAAKYGKSIANASTKGALDEQIKLLVKEMEKVSSKKVNKAPGGFRDVEEGEILPAGYTTKMNMATGKNETNAPRKE